MKRKFKECENNKRDLWWYLIRGSEATLTELESLWSGKSLQVGWKLEICTKPREDDSATDAADNPNAKENEGSNECDNELRGPSPNTATGNSHPSPAANSPETDSARSPDQPSDVQSCNIDDVIVNTNNNSTDTRQNDSNTHNSYHNTSPTPSTNSSAFLGQ